MPDRQTIVDTRLCTKVLTNNQNKAVITTAYINYQVVLPIYHRIDIGVVINTRYVKPKQF